jgi:hypothetical protein
MTLHPQSLILRRSFLTHQTWPKQPTNLNPQQHYSPVPAGGTAPICLVFLEQGNSLVSNSNWNADHQCVDIEHRSSRTESWHETHLLLAAVGPVNDNGWFLSSKDQAPSPLIRTSVSIYIFQPELEPVDVLLTSFGHHFYCDIVQ